MASSRVLEAKKLKKEHAAEKVLTTVFLDAKGVLLIEFKPHRVTQTSHHT